MGSKIGKKRDIKQVKMGYEMGKEPSINRIEKLEGFQCCNQRQWHKFGVFKRQSDSRIIQRFRCHSCGKTMSNATVDPACWQKKRQLNHMCMMLLGSCVSMRRISKLLNINQKTVARKLEYLGTILKSRLDQQPLNNIQRVQFDELQTIEHTKCKPLAVAMAVSTENRQILGFRVSVMPATGHLAKISRKKYGPRPDKRKQGLQQLFQELHSKIKQTIIISSDECSFYKSVINQYFPQANYIQFKGEKSCIAGQGELKKKNNDPLFTINHTFAMLRANINRLVRRTWCTTKKITRLIDHLTIYSYVHNTVILNPS